MLSGISNLVFQILLQLYQVTGNLGLAIISFTLLLRLLLFPLSHRSLHMQKEMRKLQPELNKLKKRHTDPKKLQQAQMDLYKNYNVNPLSGCLPQIVQLVLLIFLYHIFVNFLGQETIHGVVVSPQFLWLDLRLPDKTLILPVVVALSQLLFSVMVLPGGETIDVVPNDSKQKKIKQANKKEEDMADMAQSMQKQMLFVMPVMTGFFAARFPSGLALYWLISTLASMVQQFSVSGWGGLMVYTQRIWNSLRAS